MADTDPLEYKQRKHPDLDINEHGLTLWDLEREFPTGGFGGKPLMKLREILGVLRDSYCRTVGVEYMHIQNPEERAWLQDRIERPHGRPSHDEQMQILSRLNVAEAFEMFLQTKFVGQRRFSLEGAESLIPLLDAVLTEAATASLDEAVIGDGAPRQAERAGQHRRQVVRADLRRVRGQPGPAAPPTGPATSSTTSAPTACSTPATARPSPPRWSPTPATSRRSTRSPRASSAPSRTCSTWASPGSPCCRCSSTATRRSRGRASWPRP